MSIIRKLDLIFLNSLLNLLLIIRLLLFYQFVFSIQWSRVGSQELPSTATQKDGVLSVYNANPADSGIYVCRVTARASGATEDIQARVSISSSRYLRSNF